MIKRLALLLLLLCPFSLRAAPAITVSASAVTLLGTSQSISITVQLVDPNNTGMLKVSGTGIVPIMRASTVTPGTTATVGPIYGNDVILDGFGNSNTTYYIVQVFTVNGGFISSTPSLQNFYAFTGSGTVDLSTATPLAPSFFSGPSGNVVMPGSLTVNGAAGIIDNGPLTVSGTGAFTGGGSLQGTWTAGPSYGISTVTETGNIVTVTTTVPCPAITTSYQSIVVSGVGIAGYNTGPNGLVGFVTTAACSGSTFTYYNPTSGLANSSGGTVTVSPTFPQGMTHTGPETITGQLTTTNNNGTFWAPPGTSGPTIDQSVSACGANPCFSDISPTSGSPESSNIQTISTGNCLYEGPLTTTVVDRRGITTGCGGSGNLYPICYGCRLAGQLVRMGVNMYSHNPTDSTAGASSFIWADGTMPSNGGQQAASINVLNTHDTITFGSATPSMTGVDSEVYHDATTVDKDLPYLAAYNGQGGANRANAVGNIGTLAVYSAGQGVNIGTGKVPNFYAFDATKSGSPGIGTSRNYGLHSGFPLLMEVDTSIDFNDASQPITSLSEAVNTVTVTMPSAGQCTWVTGGTVNIFGAGTTVLGYNGTFTVLTPGCNGGTSFTYTNPISGLATLNSPNAGRVQGVHQFVNFKSSDASVTFTPQSNTVGWKFNTIAGVTAAQITQAGIFGAGTVGASGGNGGAFLGSTSAAFAGMYFLETSVPAGVATLDVCGGVSATHTFNCSYNGDGPSAAGFPMTRTIGSGTTTTNGTGINTLTSQSQPAITITGALATDVATCSLNAAMPATWQTGIQMLPPVVTANTVTVWLSNPTATATITPAATVVRCTVTR